MLQIIFILLGSIIRPLCNEKPLVRDLENPFHNDLVITVLQREITKIMTPSCIILSFVKVLKGIS